MPDQFHSIMDIYIQILAFGVALAVRFVNAIALAVARYPTSDTKCLNLDFQDLRMIGFSVNLEGKCLNQDFQYLWIMRC